MNFTGEFLHMDGNNYNSNKFGPSTVGNNSGGTPGGGPSGGGPDHTNVTGYATADESERGVRRSNPMSLTEMGNSTSDDSNKQSFKDSSSESSTSEGPRPERFYTEDRV